MLNISKQSVYQYQSRENIFVINMNNLIVKVDKLRSMHPGCGIEKLYKTLKPDFIGRDKFIDIFMSLGYRIKKPKNYVRTTIPTHLKYPNLIEGMSVIRKNQVWQTDITYFYFGGKFYYIIFIIDVYTRKIVGHKVSNNMKAQANILTLKSAIKSQNCSLDSLIHHSDRGSQYVANDYIKILNNNNVAVSMGFKAQDNAYAERVNGIIKNEFLLGWEIKSFPDLKRKLNKAVKYYNEERSHSSLLNELSPVKFEKYLLNLPSQERPKVIIYAEGKCKTGEASSLHSFKPREEPQAHNCPMECL